MGIRPRVVRSMVIRRLSHTSSTRPDMGLPDQGA